MGMSSSHSIHNSDLSYESDCEVDNGFDAVGTSYSTPITRMVNENPFAEDNKGICVCEKVDHTMSKRIKLNKTDDDAIPLPNPFLLPKHFRADVEVALKSGKMTKETESAFLSAVASSMLIYKRYPTKDDYILVARTIVEKYKFMASPVGTPYVSCQ